VILPPLVFPALAYWGHSKGTNKMNCCEYSPRFGFKTFSVLTDDGQEYVNGKLRDYFFNLV